MISQDTKDRIDREIEAEAYKWDAYYQNEDSFIMPARLFRFGKHVHNQMLTKYADKLEEKDKEIEKLTEDSRLWKIAHDNCANHFDDLKKQLESKDRELAQLKEFQIWFYKKQFGFETDKSAQSNIDSDYAEWHKQNLK